MLLIARMPALRTSSEVLRCLISVASLDCILMANSFIKIIKNNYSQFNLCEAASSRALCNTLFGLRTRLPLSSQIYRNKKKIDRSIIGVLYWQSRLMATDCTQRSCQCERTRTRPDLRIARSSNFGALKFAK